ncbi:MAG: hypothetical protein H6608_10770 [Flavobacteriales bacterium]|nr:hypothetical protein [Bacteroidota bacterium]MCB9241609.1 hypothetical protein [Flavobacteriales bacterium]
MKSAELELRDVFNQMMMKFERLPSHERRGRYLQTTRITQWLSDQLKREIPAKTVVKLFEERGYEFVFEKGGFHHWVRNPS